MSTGESTVYRYSTCLALRGTLTWERDASACMRRHQAFALPPVRHPVPWSCLMVPVADRHDDRHAAGAPEPPPAPPRLLLHHGAGVVVLPRGHRGVEARVEIESITVHLKQSWGRQWERQRGSLTPCKLKAVCHILVSNAKIQALSRCVSSGQPAPPDRGRDALPHHVAEVRARPQLSGSI